MRINLLCSDRHLPPQVLSTQKHEHWGGIDRGTLILVNHAITPTFSIGDFDSVSDEERHQLKHQLNIKPVKAEKDDTDLALGVEEAVHRGFTQIHIYGATGGRLDHFMGVMQILQKPKYIERNISIIVEDDQNEIKLLKQGTHQIQKSLHFPYVSFIPVTENVVLSLKGFKYNLNKQLLEKGSTLTLSNEVKEAVAEIILHNGQVLQMRSKDES